MTGVQGFCPASNPMPDLPFEGEGTLATCDYFQFTVTHALSQTKLKRDIMSSLKQGRTNRLLWLIGISDESHHFGPLDRPGQWRGLKTPSRRPTSFCQSCSSCFTYCPSYRYRCDLWQLLVHGGLETLADHGESTLFV